MPSDHRRLHSDLLAHYDRHRRDLPWRQESDPYRILVSEVMLQQTRVETVEAYYLAWLRRFPDAEALAEASEAEVLKAWEGLGYYRRARNLHRAARVVRERHGGRVPSTVEELRELPGVGEYTAGAVASIAFQHPEPAVDGNVRRVLARWHDVAEPSPRWLRERAAELVHPARPGDWNQALMELGATVCTPRAPRCSSCPVSWACASRSAGTVEERPVSVRRRPPRSATFALAVLRSAAGEVLLERRPSGGLLGGMWALPEAEVQGERESWAAAAEIAEGLELGAPMEEWRALPHVRHRFTHIDATYVPWLLEVGEPDVLPSGARRRWADADGRRRLAIPVAQRAVLAER